MAEVGNISSSMEWMECIKSLWKENRIFNNRSRRGGENTAYKVIWTRQNNHMPGVSKDGKKKSYKGKKYKMLLKISPWFHRNSYENRSMMMNL